MLIISAIILVACGSPATNETASPTVANNAETQTTEAPTPTSPEPSATPLPSRNLVLFVAPLGANAELVSEITDTLTKLAASSSLEIEVRETFSREDISPSLRLVIALPPDPGLADLADAAPPIQFLGISIPGLEAAHNLSLINSDGLSPDRIGFLAGYLSAVVTEEWRVAAITTNDTDAGLAHRQGFLNGAVFFCGLCQQTYPPFNAYPISVEAPANSGTQEWLALGSFLIDQAVNSVFLAPGVDDSALHEFLAEAGVNLVGVIPPPPGLEEQWIATISGDITASIEEMWPNLIAGQGGATVTTPLTISNINPDLFSPGRQRLVEKVIVDLSNGYIDTGAATNLPSP